MNTPTRPTRKLQTPFHTLEGYSNTTDLYIQGHSHRGPPIAIYSLKLSCRTPLFYSHPPTQCLCTQPAHERVRQLRIKERLPLAHGRQGSHCTASAISAPFRCYLSAASSCRRHAHTQEPGRAAHTSPNIRRAQGDPRHRQKEFRDNGAAQEPQEPRAEEGTGA